ncbi:MAG: AI-2E family transporter, partial [Pseudomonadota bacterium]|nr:AI-2E family transporter [Pseudomonadota bacterium]
MAEISNEPFRPKIAARAAVEPARLPGIDSLTMTVTIVIVVTALYLAREALIPVALAILLSFILGPLVELLRRIGAGHVTSVLAAAVGALAVLLLLAGLIGTQIASLAAQVPLYQTTIEHKIDTLRTATVGRISAAMNQIGRAAKQAGADAVPPKTNAAAPAIPPPVQVEVHQPPPTPMDVAERYL